MLLRWVSEADLPALYDGAGGDRPRPRAGAGTIADITACPGTDTCKLGISSSRALAAELRTQLRGVGPRSTTRTPRGLHIKVSGCFNSCGQHHVADIGFFGVSRNVNGRRVPHFQLVVGGQWTNNGGSYGLAIGAVPSKRVPEVVKRLTGALRRRAAGGETLRRVRHPHRQEDHPRAGRGAAGAARRYDQDPQLLLATGATRASTPSATWAWASAPARWSRCVELGLAASEREIFEAQLLLDEGKIDGARWRAPTAPCWRRRAR